MGQGNRDRLFVDGNAGWTRNDGKRSECVRSTPRIRVMGKSIRNRASKVTVQDVQIHQEELLALLHPRN